MEHQLLHELKHLNNMNTPFHNRIKKQQRRNERLMRKAARISARQSGESMGGIDYELPKVQKVLSKINKAKTISYNDVDPRIEEQGKRYDSGINYGSPLNSYASGSGGMKYVSILPHIQKLQKSFTDLAINSEENKFNKDLYKTDKDYTQESVESRIFGKKKKSKKPIDIQDIDVYEHDPGLDDNMII